MLNTAGGTLGTGEGGNAFGDRFFIRGFDARTGRRLWSFHVVPRTGEFGYDTWLKDSAVYSGNAGTWSWLSADANPSSNG